MELIVILVAVALYAFLLSLAYRLVVAIERIEATLRGVRPSKLTTQVTYKTCWGIVRLR
jgi:hypothetical protein